jgi:hypothetical protein
VLKYWYDKGGICRTHVVNGKCIQKPKRRKELGNLGVQRGAKMDVLHSTECGVASCLGYVNSVIHLDTMALQYYRDVSPPCFQKLMLIL